MLKKIFSLLVVFSLCLLAGCENRSQTSADADVSVAADSSETVDSTSSSIVVPNIGGFEKSGPPFLFLLAAYRRMPLCDYRKIGTYQKKSDHRNGEVYPHLQNPSFSGSS